MKYIFWIIFGLLAIAAIAFSVNNRDVATIDLWPSPYTVELPIFGVALIGVFVGFVWGGIVSWTYGGKTRQRVRDQYRRAENTQREMAFLRHKLAKLESAEKVAAIPAPPATAA